MPRFSLPPLKDLRNSFSDLEKSYREEKSKPNEVRLNQLDFVGKIIASLKGLDFTTSEIHHRFQADNKRDSRNIKKQVITGSLLFLAKQIKMEYESSSANNIPFYSRWVKPENSVLYQGIFRALGINDSNYLEKQDELNFLTQFRYYLEDLMDNPSNSYLDVSDFNLSFIMRDIRQLTLPCSIDRNSLSQAKTSLRPGQNQVDMEINDHKYSSTIHIWQKMMETTCNITKPEDYSKEQIETIQDTLKEVEEKQQYKHKIIEYNLHGYRRAFENDKEALKRIDEHEKPHSQLLNEIKGSSKKDINIDNIERLDVRGPRLYGKEMHKNRELFFNSLKNEVENFDKGNLRPVENENHFGL